MTEGKETYDTTNYSAEAERLAAELAALRKEHDSLMIHYLALWRTLASLPELVTAVLGGRPGPNANP